MERKRLWKHYKGGMYQILHTATHTETGEDLVVYQSLNGNQVWVRPADMFYGAVELENGKKVPRFRSYMPI